MRCVRQSGSLWRSNKSLSSPTASLTITLLGSSRSSLFPKILFLNLVSPCPTCFTGGLPVPWEYRLLRAGCMLWSAVLHSAALWENSELHWTPWVQQTFVFARSGQQMALSQVCLFVRISRFKELRLSKVSNAGICYMLYANETNEANEANEGSPSPNLWLLSKGLVQTI